MSRTDRVQVPLHARERGQLALRHGVLDGGQLEIVASDTLE
ncbi:MAG: hypothetical protein U0Y82_00135 [Thermoleophilia bacterium]